MNRIGVFPGSFDPITVGHEDIINRSIDFFDTLYIAIGHNSSKNYMFSVDERITQLETIFKNNPKIKIVSYTGLTIDYCKEVNANYILRGIRTATDFEFERNIGLMNLEMAPDIETILLLSRPEFSALSSSVVRDIKRNNGDISKFLPIAIR